MIVLDTSAAIAAALVSHDAHERVLAVVAGEWRPVLAPVAVETYSVLTRLPPPQRLSPDAAYRHLTESYLQPPLALSPAGFRRVIERARGAGIAGGAVYDAVVAAAAYEADATLLSLDRRAVRAYDAIGVRYELVPA